jgi:hypothetical protein
MRVREVAPDPDCGALLPDAQFADAHCVDIGDTDIDAREACVRMVLHPPRWIDALLRLRNIMVSPFGLKTSGEGAPAPGGLIGLFETPERLVAGFNDYILNFVSWSMSIMPRTVAKSFQRRWCGRTICWDALISLSSCLFTS